MESWGRFPKVYQESVSFDWRSDEFPTVSEGQSILPFGQGRSYGDSCLNGGNTVVLTRRLNRFISFDRSTGLIRCEAGVTLEQVLRLVVPLGWFLPVTPGTQFVSLGGAIANDIHGKNHHRAGSFGRFLTRFELLRSDGSRLICSREQNSEWFSATIGGLGLTGLITWAEIQLGRIHNPFISQEVIRFQDVDEFFQLSRESEKEFEYTVAWIDCLARGKNLGRGLFIRGNHAPAQIGHPIPIRANRKKVIPSDAPSFVLNPFTVRAFNLLYYWKQLERAHRSVVHYDPFFYPLDAILHWNRIYGKRGFMQYQVVVPYEENQGKAVREILNRVAQTGLGSFLAVMKIFGDFPSPGMMSFPRPGVTLTLDFPVVGDRIFRLLDELDQVVMRAGGAVYPAKDARMSREAFQMFFPRYQEFKAFVDPRFSSSFWRRVS